MLLSRRFLPYFVTQCLGALNDNVFKNVLLLLVAYSQVDELPIDVNLFVNLAAGLFILPFLLFSAHAGQVADYVDKSALIRRLKLLELVIMSFAVFAIVSHSYMVMLLLLFLMGVQSAYFGPVKYSLLPRVLDNSELVSGNAWVEMGTFLAILAGTISAGLIVASDNATYWAAASVFILALIGALTSWFIPSIPAHSLQKPHFSIVRATFANIKKARRTPGIWVAILAISWFWFVGATYLTQFPNFARITLAADPTVVSLLLLLFSVGIAAGSFVCERLSCHQVELGIMPLGLALLAGFGIDLYFAIPAKPELAALYNLQSFIAEADHYRLMLDLFMIGGGGGLFIVPLYTYIQARAKDGECAQAIASNNIINALFMVTSAVFAMVILNVFQWQIEQLFLLLAVGNVLVLCWLLLGWPELLLSMSSYYYRRFKHKVSLDDPNALHKQAKLIVVTDNLSWSDMMLLYGSFTHPVHFTEGMIQRLSLNRFYRRAVLCISYLASSVDDATDNNATTKDASTESYEAAELDIDSVICVSAVQLKQVQAELKDYTCVTTKLSVKADGAKRLVLEIRPLTAG
ncbi:MFS transporter [Shewanella marinintestina]|uniref:MFS transporter n=1 Tax=Shewanella marinintestina TaxID=190305 RepID=UPI00200E72CF|nr:MFS transporter [Shewanella marinintestina]MCL1147819.1 MFS transporter [Shewanella marinintestina]